MYLEQKFSRCILGQNGSYGQIRLENVESKSTHFCTSESSEDASVPWDSLEKILVCSIPPIYFLFIYFLIEVELICNVVLVSSAQQSDSARYICEYIHIYILFQFLFPCGLLQNIEWSSLCYTVGPCSSSILYILVCICYSQIPNLPLPCNFPLW